MNGFEAFSPWQWILLSVLASLVANLAVLGLVLARGDRQTYRLLKQADEDRESEVKRLSHRLEECEERHRIQMKDLRQAVARLELRGAGRPSSDGPESAARPERVSRKAIDKKHQVYRLARRGVGPQGIARRLNIYQGEAELLLGLKGLMGAGENTGGRTPAERTH